MAFAFSVSVLVAVTDDASEAVTVAVFANVPVADERRYGHHGVGDGAADGKTTGSSMLPSRSAEAGGSARAGGRPTIGSDGRVERQGIGDMGTEVGARSKLEATIV